MPNIYKTPITFFVDGHEITLSLDVNNSLFTFPDSIIESGVQICFTTLDILENSEVKPGVNILKTISHTLFNFLEADEIILLFYCSSEKLEKRHCTKGQMSSQRYRRTLFETMFNRYIPKESELRILFRDLTSENTDEHHVGFIYKKAIKT